MDKLTLRYPLTDTDLEQDAASLLARHSGLSKMAIKDAMRKGAVWHERGKQRKRLRRATFVGRPGDVLHLHYDAMLLKRQAPQAQLLSDEKRYSVWVKPAGVLAQGTLEGDHCSLLRQAEVQLQREVFLVHRLDREAAGLMLIAHDPKAAAAFSQLFAAGKSEVLRKRYWVLVKGRLGEEGSIEAALDGKAALTRYHPLPVEVTPATPIADASWLEVELVTGRKHQIRRHLAGINHPVLGDPRYGSGNTYAAGLQLYAVLLGFVCPLRRRPREYRWSPSLAPEPGPQPDGATP
ncbi:MAG TPA: RluA family pseudouridine synthase [Hyphomicrobiales bacterium]|nr:RluA family pseudouridine synthase [Hyphomicrobiales bacterium]